MLVQGGAAGAESSAREDVQWSSMELSHSASYVIGETIGSFPSFPLGRMT